MWLARAGLKIISFRQKFFRDTLYIQYTWHNDLILGSLKLFCLHRYQYLQASPNFASFCLLALMVPAVLLYEKNNNNKTMPGQKRNQGNVLFQSQMLPRNGLYAGYSTDPFACIQPQNRKYPQILSSFLTFQILVVHIVATHPLVSFTAINQVITQEVIIQLSTLASARSLRIWEPSTHVLTPP